MKEQKADLHSSANTIHCDINKFFKKEKYNMSKRILSLFMALVLCFSMLPAAVLAEETGASQGTAEQSVTGIPVAKVGDMEYETLQEILENMEAVEITLLDNVSEEDLTVYAATTIIMNGYSITGNIDATADLTLTGGIVDGTVKVDGGTLNMTAPETAEAAITKGLNVVSGSAYVSGAKVGVKFSLSFDGDELTISGSEKAVDLVGAPFVGSTTIYGATDENGEANLPTDYDADTGTYMIYSSVAKKISNKQEGGSQSPAPVPVTIELAPETAEIYGGQSAKFTVSYNGTDELEAYVQKNAQDDTIDAAYDANTGIVTVTTTEEVTAGKYTLYVHEVNDTSIAAKADITVKNAVAMDSDGNYYSDIKTAVEGAADGSTITVIAKDNQLSLPDGIYVKTESKGLTLDLNGRSLGGYSLNVGGYSSAGKLTVTDRGGNGAVGLIVRDGGTVIFAPENVNTALLQLQVYGGYVTLRGGHINAGQWDLQNNVKLSDLIPSDEGYAYRFYRRVNELTDWVSLADAQNNAVGTTFGLAVMKCEHEGADESNNCLYCGTALVAKNGSKYYTSFEAAIAAANENDTVTLLKSVDEHCTIEKNMTIDLGGNKINNNITIKSGSTLTLEGEGTVNVVQSGTELDGVVGGALNVLSDDVIVGTLSVNQIPNPKMNLRQGTFWKIKLSDNLINKMTASKLLADGYAFASNGSGNVVDGYVYKLENVKVVSHTHDITTDNKCVCGFTCNHSNGFTEEGKCKDCGYVCPHTNVGDDGKCTVCGTAMVAKVEVGETITYASDLAYALNNAVNGATITLLTDVSNSGKRACVTGDGKTVTLNLNGKTISEGWINVGIDADGNTYTSSTLKITGSGSFTTSGSIYVGQLAKLDLSSWGGGENDTISAVAMSGRNGSDGKLLVGEKAGTINTLGFYNWRLSSISSELRGGTYGQITITISDSLISSIPYSDALAEGYALQYTGSGEYVEYTTAANYSGINTIQNIKVVKCDHGGTSGFTFEYTSPDDLTASANCPYCGASAVAGAELKDGEDFRWRKFVNLQDAFDAVRDGGSDIYLLANVTGDYTIDGTQNTGLDLNGHSINGTVDVNAVAEGKNYTTTFSNTKNTTTASIDEVVAHSGAKLAGSGYPAVIGKLWLSDTTKWEYILNEPARLGFKVLNEDGTHKWYAPNDKSIPAPLVNVIIDRLPITSKNLSFKVDGTNVKGNKVERGTTVQLCANCNTSGADVYIYTGVPAGDGTFTYSQKKAEYKKIGTTLYYVVDLYANTIGTYDIYFTASKDGYSVTSSHKKLTVTKLNLSNAEITFPDGNEAVFNYVTATGVPKFIVTYNGKELKQDVDFTITSGGSTYDVGSCTLTVTAAENGDYTGSKSANWNVRPLKAAVSVGDIIKTYDGTTDLPADAKITFVSADSYYTGAVLPLAKSTDYELLNAHYDSANAGEKEKTISFTIKLKNEGYVFEDGTTEKDFTLNGAELDDKTFKINPAAIDLSGIQFEQIIYNDLAKTYEIDLKPMLEAVLRQQKPAGVEYGSIKYQACDYTFNPNDYLADTTVSVSNEGILSLPIASANKVAAGTEIGTLNVNVSTTNYGLFKLPVTVKVGEKITPVPSEGFTVSATDITYGQTLADSTLTATGSMICPRTLTVIPGEFKWTDCTVMPDAGNYKAEWTFTPAEGYEEYAVATGTVTVNVNKAPLVEGVDYEVPTAKSGLIYDGDENGLELITPGTIAKTGLTMQYKLGNDGAWSTEIPKATNAGSYEVYYCVLGGENYKDTAEVLVKDCAIAKRPVTISNKPGDEGYQTEYMYGNRIFEPEVSNFEITGSEGEPEFSYQWIGEKPQAFSALGDYMVRVIVSETANTTGVSWDIPVKIVQNTSSVGYMSGFDYMVYNNTGTVSYDIDFVDGVDSHATMLDRESLTLKDFIIVVRDANGNYNSYDEDTCDFKIAVTEGAEKGTVRVTLMGLNRDTASEYSFCMIGVQAENKHYANISLQVRLKVQEKGQQTLGVTMTGFTYGDPASTPAYTAPEGTLETNVTYATKDGTPLAKEPTAAGDYTVTVVCETKDTTYSSGLIAYTINPKPIGDISLTLDKDSFIYNGSAQKPVVTAKMNDTELADTDYTVTYPTDMTNIGTKVLKVEGHGNFTGEKELPYTIETCNTAPVLTLSQTEYVYDGTEKKPVVTVTVEGRHLAEGQDYEVVYANNTNAEDGAKVTVTSKGNYGFAPAEQGFAIHKAPIQIQPQDAVKTYGQKATLRYTLSGGDFLTPAELEEIDKLVVLASDGVDEKTLVDANGYAISAQLKQTETANLLLSIEGTAKVVVNKAPLTVKVKDVSREYGAENPELSVSYSGFVNGEDESVLGGTLVLKYNDEINETAAVGPHENVTTASGLTSENYAIEFVPGNVTIAKIPVNASAGTARRSYLNVVFDKSLEGLSTENFIVKDSEGNIVTVTNITASSDGKNYTLSGNFEVGKEYTVKVVLSGAAVDATHQLATDEFVITPIRTSSGGGGTTRYTVSFETNGGSELSKQTVTRNTAVKEPTVPTKEGFDFAGWYADKELKTKYDFSAKVTKSITLYAAWTEKDNSINQIILTIGEKDALVFGAVKTNDVAPKIVNNRTMLPARFVAENLGADVSWDGEKELVTIQGKNLKTSEDVTILIYIGSDIAYVNGKETKLDSAAFIENDRTYTPIRFISEELGASVEWIESEQKVVITKTLPSKK